MVLCNVMSRFRSVFIYGLNRQTPCLSVALETFYLEKCSVTACRGTPGGQKQEKPLAIENLLNEVLKSSVISHIV